MTIKISPHQKRGIESLADALSEFEPLAKRWHLGQTVMDQLIDLGLAERGPCSPQFAARGHRDGYRLTAEGWQALTMI